MNYLFTPAFCRTKMLEYCLAHIYKTPPKLKFTHAVIDQRYPLPPHSAKNRSRIKDLCRDYSATYVDSKEDLGLHRGLNHAMKEVGVKPEDFIAGCDPDDRPSPGWLDALHDVMSVSPKLAVLGLTFSVIKDRVAQGVPFQHKKIAGHQVLIHPGLEMWNVCAFNTKLIFEIGGFTQPNGYYGGIEIALHRAWASRGMCYGYLADYCSDAEQVDRSDPEIHDSEYRAWKTDHVTGYAGSFQKWLGEHGKLLLDTSSSDADSGSASGGNAG